jgi:hypothetical protein
VIVEIIKTSPLTPLLSEEREIVATPSPFEGEGWGEV